VSNSSSLKKNRKHIVDRGKCYVVIGDELYNQYNKFVDKKI